jgi:hypothetical protein
MGGFDLVVVFILVELIRYGFRSINPDGSGMLRCHF